VRQSFVLEVLRIFTDSGGAIRYRKAIHVRGGRTSSARTWTRRSQAGALMHRIQLSGDHHGVPASLVVLHPRYWAAPMTADIDALGFMRRIVLSPDFFSSAL
jgi:hypothetical protein